MNRPLPIYFGVPTLSYLGTMMFPEDPEKAESFVALRLVRATTDGPGMLAEYRAQGGVWPEIERRAHEAVLGQNRLAESEVADRWLDGQRVGEVVKVLWAMVSSGDPDAGWRGACKHVEAAAGRAPGSVSMLQAKVSSMAPVLHLWGAWSMRGRRFNGPDGVDDAWLFVTEAEILLTELRRWRDGRAFARRDQDQRLSAQAYGLACGPHPAAVISALELPARGLSEPR